MARRAVVKRIFANGKHPQDGEHMNVRSFSGVLAITGTPSDKAPSGARGHRVILTERAAENALQGLVGMAISYKAGWDGHDTRQKCGLITGASIRKGRIEVIGYLWSRDFPEVVRTLESKPDGFGMSYELGDAHIDDLRSEVWEIKEATFTGASILTKDKAAYKGTSFTLNTPKAREIEESRPWWTSICSGTAWTA